MAVHCANLTDMRCEELFGRNQIFDLLSLGLHSVLDLLHCTLLQDAHTNVTFTVPEKERRQVYPVGEVKPIK